MICLLSYPQSSRVYIFAGASILSELNLGEVWEGPVVVSSVYTLLQCIVFRSHIVIEAAFTEALARKIFHNYLATYSSLIGITAELPLPRNPK